MLERPDTMVAIIKGLRHELIVHKPYWLHAGYIPPSATTGGTPSYHLLVCGPYCQSVIRPRAGNHGAVTLLRLLALEDGLNLWRCAYLDESFDEEVELDLMLETFVGVFPYEDPYLYDKIQKEITQRLMEHDRRRSV